MMQPSLTIVFLTNFYTFHQEELSEALFQMTNGEYYFIETVNVRDEQKQKDLDMERPFVLHYWDDLQKARCEELINQADVVLIGDAPDRLFAERLKRKKLTFRYSERLYKTQQNWKTYPRARISAWLHHGRFQKHPLYMLCASAFTAADCQRFRNYQNRAYRWGYFPAMRKYDVCKLLKEKLPASILWVGRMINWKHPDDALMAALKLKQAGYRFDLRFVGDGDMRRALEKRTAELQLMDCVSFLGMLRPEEVREQMEQAEIFLFTSDRGEGWGAVLNEAMNSGCATVSSHSIGSVPFMVEDGTNGLIYASGDVDMLTRRVQWLLDHPEERKALGMRAYQTTAELWNARVAASRLIELSHALLSGDKSPKIFEKGPCSVSPILDDDWYDGE